MMQKKRVRLAAVGDLHCTKRSERLMSELFARAAEEVDVLLLCGDLTDYGLPEEAETLAKAMESARGLPLIGVLGNHDHESANAGEVSRILGDAGLVLLDGDIHVVDSIGFAGVKGFVGGFGAGMLQPWGEATIKAFVHETLEEVLKLERAMSSLRTQSRVVLLHYAPVEGTVVGEPREIFPFLGSGRFEDCINRYAADIVFHGHAHRGTSESKTSCGIPVYNVALPLMQKELGRPFRVIEFPLE